MEGGEISGNDNNGISLWSESRNVVLDITGGTISGNHHGVSVGGKDNTITMSDGTLSGSFGGIEFWLESENNYFTLSGGTMDGRAVNANGKGNTITIAGGGTIKTPNGTSIEIGEEGSEGGCVLDISGGEIIGNNNSDAIRVRGNKQKIYVKNGTISGSREGIRFDDQGSSDCDLTVSGGTTSGVDNEEYVTIVASGGTDHDITISGGKVPVGKKRHIDLYDQSSNNTLTVEKGALGITDNDIWVINHGTGNTMNGNPIDNP